jgi:hypothetical protein
MSAIKSFAWWAWSRIVALAQALNSALATPAPLETDGYDDTVFQPRD